MEIERETLLEAGVAAFGVGVFIAAVVLVGATYGIHETADSMVATTLEATGALALVAGITLFIVVMAGIGLWLAGRQEADA